MDCQKFDSVMMDALYDELDELTHAAAKRHMEGCSRCANLFAGLRATHDVGVLPLEEPSEGLEPRILAATLAAQQKTPWHRKALRGLAWAGSHAMRPQLAMAALFVLVIGSSLLLLRPMPASMPAPVRVTERGVPAPEPSEVQISAPVAAIPTVGAPPPAIALSEDTAAGKKEKGAAEGAEEKPSDAKAALAEARAVRQKSGCGAAVKAYDDVGARFPATVSAADAMWEAAECYKAMGDTARARELYLSLQSFSSYRARAEQELAADQAGTSNSQASQLAARAAGGMPPAAAPAAPAQAAPPVAVASKAAAKPTATAVDAALDNENEAEAKKPAGGAAGAPKAAAPVRTKAAPASAEGY